MKLNFKGKKNVAEGIITQASSARTLGAHVNSDIVRTMAEQEGHNAGALNNWILVFDWNDGNFVTWEAVGRSADEAISAYTRYERQFPEEDKYEVVLIGTSDISTVQQTHSHYFGIEHHNTTLESMESSIIGLAKRSELDVGSRRILMTMKRRNYWGHRSISISTLRNHFCQNIAGFDLSLEALRQKGFVVGNDPISLDIKKTNDINSYA